MIEFKPFPKMARLKRECLITEKIDGTNAQIYITDSMEVAESEAIASWPIENGFGLHGHMFAGSRTHFITPGKKTDNQGFAAWVLEHATELLTLGPGQHFGEWWGQGIQRAYGLTEKRFSLFNAWRWNDGNPNRPACCHVVPTLFSGKFSTEDTQQCIDRLKAFGSAAAPGFMKPEGIVIFLSAARSYFKQTIEDDDEPKSLKEAA